MEAGQRREAVREMVNDGMTQRKIGDVLGVGQKTVSRDLNFESNDSKTEKRLSQSDLKLHRYCSKSCRQREYRIQKRYALWLESRKRHNELVKAQHAIDAEAYLVTQAK
jgi:predicted transcriptional regulator